MNNNSPKKEKAVFQESNTEIIGGSPTNNLADVLERVLDKGIVIAGDIKIQIADIDLLNIKIRLLITSVDKAKEIGIDWWSHDPYLSSMASYEEIEQKGNTKKIKKVAARSKK